MTQSVGLNSIKELWQLQQLNGSQTNQQPKINNDDGSIMNALSDYYKPETGDNLESEYAQALSAIGATNNVNGTSEVDTDNKTKEEIEKELEELQEKREKIEEEMEAIESEIEDLAQQAEEDIKNALAEKEEKTEEYDEEAQQALKDNINAYVEANKEGGEGMTREELQQNIKDSLPNSPQLAETMATLTNASDSVNEIDSLLKDLNGKIQEANAMDGQIGSLEEECKQIEEAEEKKCCDPIGFTAGEGENAAKYDFIIDDGNFDSTSDFLGANGQWSAMQALDTDGDNIVSSSELKAGNIKAVKTGADGSQSIVDLMDEFGSDFSIDLSSYKQGGSHNAVNTSSDSDGDGVKDQQLLGTFNVNANGQTLNGYNTLDDNEWLESNYGIESDNMDNPFGEFSGDDSSNSLNPEDETNGKLLNPDDYSEQLQPHVNFFNTYTEINEEFKKQLDGAYENIGLNEEEINDINNSLMNKANAKAKNDETNDENSQLVESENTSMNENLEEEEYEKELIRK